ncbi:MAG: hypothetical protein ABIL39_08140 [candidate division WOR-3 bacterium]
MPLFTLGIGLGGFNIYWGTLWFPYKIVAVFIFLIVFLKYNCPIRTRFFNIFIYLLLFSLFVALILRPPNEPSNLPLLQRSYMRPFVQLFSYLSIVSLIPFVLKTLKNNETIHKFFRDYYLIVEVVMLFALLQFILLKLGLDFMPILRPNASDSPTAAFGVGDILIVRLYGVSGEPKTLAGLLFPYFFISLYNFYNRNYNRNYTYHLIMLLVCLFVMINAFSSAVLISLALGLFLTAFIWFRAKLKFILPFAVLVFSLKFLNPGKYSITPSGEIVPVSLYDVILARTVTRLSIQMEKTFEYRAIKYIFEEKPYFIVTGLGLGMFPYYITGGGRHGIDPIDSQWIAFLVDFGLIGIFLFLKFFFKIYKLKYTEIFSRNILFNSCLIGLFAAYLLGLGMGSYVYIILFLSLCLAVYKNHFTENFIQKS